MSLIVCHNASFSYEGTTVVKGLSFTVDKGDYLCIVGENGSGKTTLIKGILGLKEPTEGYVKFGEGLKLKQIGYLPQFTVTQQDFPASVREVVLSGFLNSMGWRPYYNAAEKDFASNILRLLNITYLAERCYRDLSGGQKQRVLLARALCASDKVLLLDEPVTGLDPLVTKELYELIHTVNKIKNVTLIMVTHDISSVLSHADHILHLRQQDSFYGTVAEYRRSKIGKLFCGGEIHG